MHVHQHIAERDETEVFVVKGKIMFTHSASRMFAPTVHIPLRVLVEEIED